MSYSDLTVGQAYQYVAMIQDFDFSTIDWDLLISSLVDSGYYTAEAAWVIDMFRSGNYDSILKSISVVSDIYLEYDSGMSFEAALQDYMSSSNIDYSEIMPSTPPPSALDWEVDWSGVTDQLTSPILQLDAVSDAWHAGVDAVASEWSVDAVKEFLVAKTYDAAFEQADEYFSLLAHENKLTSLYEDVQEAKRIYDSLTNFHTNLFNLLTDGVDAIAGKSDTTPQEYFDNIDSVTRDGVRDLLDIDGKVKSALDWIGSGFLNSDESEFSPLSMVPYAALTTAADADTSAFRLTLSTIDGPFRGTSGADGLSGGAGKDTLELQAGNDVGFGGAGADVLNGGAGKDWLGGGSGADRLIGGIGADRLVGGTGADRFVYKTIKESTPASAGRDMIYDFTRVDDIDVHSVDANTKKSGNQDFTFIGTASFHGVSGELRYTKQASGSFIYGDVNGDRKADFAIAFDDAIRFTKDMFIL